MRRCQWSVYVCWLIAPLLLVALLGRAVHGDVLCKEASQKLPNEPNIQAFRKCAAKKPIVPECCRKLLKYVMYIGCINDPQYEKAADDFLRGVTTVNEVQMQCLS